VALALLRAWNGDTGQDRPEPLIFTAWLQQTVRAIAADELGDRFPDYFDLRPAFVRLVLTSRPSWCDDIATPVTETCEDQLATAFHRAMGDLSAQLGSDPRKWRWGDVHIARFRHELFHRHPLGRLVADISLATDGDNFTINRGGHWVADPREPFAHIHGAGLRAVYDLANLDRSRFVLATGQSGHPLSRHYRDQLSLWQAGGSFPLAGDRADVARQARGRVRMVPATAAIPATP
jgi:penicillin amidase